MEKTIKDKYYLECITCGKTLEANPAALTCPDCGDYKGTLDVLYDYDRISENLANIDFIGENIYEIFFDILPFDNTELLPPLSVGETPLYFNERLNKALATTGTYIKDDTVNPSSSYKDRATAIAIAMAKQDNKDTIAVASTGNAAASTATLAAAAGIKAVVFVPSSAPEAKLTQLYIHGAEVLKFDANYDEIFDLCTECCNRFGWYNRNTAINPFTGEGKKTSAYEIFLDLGTAPDSIIIPVGDGCILSGIYKGYFDLLKLGLINKIPRLFGIQAEGCAPLVKSFREKRSIERWEKIGTEADSIAVGFPRDGMKALRAVSETKGEFISVSDQAIFEAQKELAQYAGIFAEPSASAAYGGYKKLLTGDLIDRNETAVIMITGSGLKDIVFTSGRLNMSDKPLKPNIQSVAEKLKM
ncbi:MAG: threonine synthase [candidate division Zixibacteria bacterium]|nr:threonine synthase [candidate division Zixibacteria bacterium]